MKPVFREKPFLFIDLHKSYVGLMTPVEFFKASMEKKQAKRTRFVVRVERLLDLVYFYIPKESGNVLEEIFSIPFLGLNANLENKHLEYAVGLTMDEFYSFEYHLVFPKKLTLTTEDIFRILVLHCTPLNLLSFVTINRIIRLVKPSKIKKVQKEHAQKNY